MATMLILNSKPYHETYAELDDRIDLWREAVELVPAMANESYYLNEYPPTHAPDRLDYAPRLPPHNSTMTTLEGNPGGHSLERVAAPQPRSSIPNNFSGDPGLVPVGMAYQQAAHGSEMTSNLPPSTGQGAQNSRTRQIIAQDLDQPWDSLPSPLSRPSPGQLVPTGPTSNLSGYRGLRSNRSLRGVSAGSEDDSAICLLRDELEQGREREAVLNYLLKLTREDLQQERAHVQQERAYAQQEQAYAQRERAHAQQEWAHAQQERAHARAREDDLRKKLAKALMEIQELKLKELNDRMIIARLQLANHSEGFPSPQVKHREDVDKHDLRSEA